MATATVGQPAAIQIDHVSKSFRRIKQAPTSIKQRLMNKIRRGGLEYDDFWALRDVAFDIQPGSSVGLIGPNGSGKTTLLKIIAGVLRPTEGTVTARGRIAALLELGAGFHQELTGRENVYLNASILGLAKKQTDAVFDSIVDFAELEEFIDTKVKFYSSGMYMRLGFAVAVHVDPEILLVDEVLAVGDEGFQHKCLNRIQNFQKEGRTIVLVTHVVDQVRDICTEGIMLLDGQIHKVGSPESVVREYRRLLLKEDVPWVAGDQTGDIEITSVEVQPAAGRTLDDVQAGDDLTIQVEFKALKPVVNPSVAITLHDHHDVLEFQESTAAAAVELGTVEGARRVRFTLRWLPYTSGEYFVTVGVTSHDERTLHALAERSGSFSIPVRADKIAVAHINTDIEVSRV